jgi:hypothetical protein
MVSLTPRPLYPRGKNPRYPRAGLDDVEKRKFLILSELELEPDPSVVQPVATRYTDYAVPALNR